uniref:Peptidase M20 dimerisation domain-containing protein n=1 Tax=Glossina palpalis gambiensis TaxID=67801 RepID=A0A1B0C740_9MUSC
FLGIIGRQADLLDLPAKVYYPVNKENPVVVISWYGTDQAAKSILLNSHMDVVPVYPENWTHPPFAAEMDNQGRIYARGSQDMKSVGMQYLAALRALRKQGLHFKRTIHVTFVPVLHIHILLPPESSSFTILAIYVFNVGCER